MRYFILLLFFLQIVNSQQNMNTDWANLSKYVFDNSKLTTPISGEHRIVFMGDSITEFWKINDELFFTSNSFINRGISGQTTSQMVVRFQQDVIDLKPTTVVLLAGINDIAENTGPISLNDILKNIISMVTMAKENKIKVVLCSVLPANRFSWNLKIKPAEKVIELNKMIKTYADANQITFVDYYDAMVDHENGLQKKYGEDGVHPNLSGYIVMEELLVNALKK